MVCDGRDRPVSVLTLLRLPDVPAGPRSRCPLPESVEPVRGEARDHLVGIHNADCARAGAKDIHRKLGHLGLLPSRAGLVVAFIELKRINLVDCELPTVKSRAARRESPWSVSVRAEDIPFLVSLPVSCEKRRRSL
jgi:hypothetical protein